MCFRHMYVKSFEQYGDKPTEYKFCDGGKVSIFDDNKKIIYIIINIVIINKLFLFVNTIARANSS